MKQFHCNLLSSVVSTIQQDIDNDGPIAGMYRIGSINMFDLVYEVEQVESIASHKEEERIVERIAANAVQRLLDSMDS
jgi:hypothetical protein